MKEQSFFLKEKYILICTRQQLGVKGISLEQFSIKHENL